MNYYQELLESYSKLKKRSLNLFVEGVGVTELSPEKKAAQPIATAAAEVVVNAPDQYMEANPYVPTAAPGVQIWADAPPAAPPEGGAPAATSGRSVRWNKPGLSRGAVLYRDGAPVGLEKVMQGQSTWGAFVSRFTQDGRDEYAQSDKSPMGMGVGEEAPTDEETAAVEAAEEEAKKILQAKMKEWSDNTTERPWRSKGVPDPVDSRTAGGFTKAENQFFDSLLESKELTPQEKTEVLEKYIEAMKILGRHQRTGMKGIHRGDLIKISNSLAFHRGNLLIKVGDRQVAFGSMDIHTAGGRGRSKFALKTKNELNSLINQMSGQLSRTPMGTEITILIDPIPDHNTDGDNPALRGPANETVKAMLANFMSMAAAAIGDRDYWMDKINKEWKLLTTNREGDPLHDLAKLARTFRLGLTPDQLQTFESIQSVNYVQSLTTFLTQHRGMDEEDAKALIGKLSEDEGRALAFALAADLHATRAILGDVTPLGAQKLGDAEGFQSLGEKSDIQYIFKPEDVAAIQDHIKKINNGKGLPNSVFTTMKASEAFKTTDEDGNEIIDLPPGVNEDDEVSVLRAEIKTMNNQDSYITYGQMQAGNYVGMLVGAHGTQGEQDFADSIVDEVQEVFGDSVALAPQLALTSLGNILSSDEMSIADAETAIQDLLGKQGAESMRAIERSADDGGGSRLANMLKNAKDDNQRKAILANAVMRGLMSEHGGLSEAERNALGYQLFSSCMGSSENIARMTFNMEENSVGITDDAVMRDKLKNGLKPEGGWSVEMTKSGHMQIKDANGDALYVMEWNTAGDSMRCRRVKNRSGYSLKEQTVIEKFLHGQAKLIDELLSTP